MNSPYAGDIGYHRPSIRLNFQELESLGKLLSKGIWGLEAMGLPPSGRLRDLPACAAKDDER